METLDSRWSTLTWVDSTEWSWNSVPGGNFSLKKSGNTENSTKIHNTTSRTNTMSIFTRISQINDYLYLCGASAVTPDRLRELGINLVVNCTLEIPNCKLPEVKFLHVQVEDAPHAKLHQHFDKCADKIEDVRKKGGRVLVHCVAGVSRSTSICLAHLMKHKAMTLLDAYKLVKSKRPIVRPNIGFFKQLINYEKKLRGKNTVKLIESPLGWVPDVYHEEAKGLTWYPV